jgi:hypothetical protein
MISTAHQGAKRAGGQRAEYNPRAAPDANRALQGAAVAGEL